MPPSCAMTIAMSASVTVSIAADSTGMLRVMPRVRRVRGSAWLGNTSEAPGTSSTSSKVRPRRMGVVETMERCRILQGGRWQAM